MRHSERKKQLIAQGALYRADIRLAKSTVSAKATRDALIGNALHHLKTSASDMVLRRIGNLSASDLQTLAPIALPLLARLLEKKNLTKAVLGTAVVAGAIGYVLPRLKKRKATRHEPAVK